LVWLIPVAVAFAGALLWWPPGEAPNKCSDLGSALVGGAVVATAVLYVEQQLSKEADRRDLKLQLGLQDNLIGIDLSGRDLAGFHLAGKDLRNAVLRGANLQRANLSGARLDHAVLVGADFRGAKLDETPLYPSKTLYPSADLVPGPILPDAVLQGVSLTGAKYDADTRWPKNFDPNAAGAVSE
jgi:uncharacterized protein YjbI with pentapeptide repeats